MDEATMRSFAAQRARHDAHMSRGGTSWAMAADVTAPDQSSSQGAVHATYDAVIDTPGGEPYSRSQVPFLPQREYAMLRGNITLLHHSPRRTWRQYRRAGRYKSQT